MVKRCPLTFLILALLLFAPRCCWGQAALWRVAGSALKKAGGSFASLATVSTKSAARFSKELVKDSVKKLAEEVVVNQVQSSLEGVSRAVAQAGFSGQAAKKIAATSSQVVVDSVLSIETVTKVAAGITAGVQEYGKMVARQVSSSTDLVSDTLAAVAAQPAEAINPLNIGDALAKSVYVFGKGTLYDSVVGAVKDVGVVTEAFSKGQWGDVLSGTMQFVDNVVERQIGVIGDTVGEFVGEWTDNERLGLAHAENIVQGVQMTIGVAQYATGLPLIGAGEYDPASVIVQSITEQFDTVVVPPVAVEFCPLPEEDRSVVFSQPGRVNGVPVRRIKALAACPLVSRGDDADFQETAEGVTASEAAQNGAFVGQK